MSRVSRSTSSAQRASPALPSFTLVEILISILILALGVLGLGALFPVIIREQRQGADATSGVFASNSARAMLTQAEWGNGLALNGAMPHPVLDPMFPTPRTDGTTPTEWLWSVLRNGDRYLLPATAARAPGDGLGRGYLSTNLNKFQRYGQGEWFVGLVDLVTGVGKIGFPDITNGLPQSPATMVKYGSPSLMVKGCVDLPVSQRLYLSSGLEPQFVWDFAVQRVTDFDHRHAPDWDDLRAAVFVRRIDQRIRLVGGATSVREALTNFIPGNPEFRFPVGEDATTGDPTFDGTGRYSGIKTCEVEFFYVSPTDPLLNHRDRLYFPNALVGTAPTNWLRVYAQMRQPGQKLVDNLGNVYTVVGSGKEPGVAARTIDLTVPGAEYLKIDPPVPESVTKERASPMGAHYTPVHAGAEPTKRAIWQVAYTPQIPVSVTLVEVAKGTRAKP